MWALWGTVFNSNIETLERFQNKIANAPWYVTNGILHHDRNVSYVRDKIKRLSRRYADRMEKYPDILAISFMRKVKTTPIKTKITSRPMYLIVL